MGGRESLLGFLLPCTELHLVLNRLTQETGRLKTLLQEEDHFVSVFPNIPGRVPELFLGVQEKAI